MKILENKKMSDMIECYQESEIKDDDSLIQDVIRCSIINDERLAESGYIAVREYGEHSQAFDMYKVKKVTTGKVTSFIGIQLGVSELKGYVVEDFRPVNRTFRYVAEQLLVGTEWAVGYVEDSLISFTDNFYYLSVKDSLRKMQASGCELLFKVEINDNQITDKYIEIHKRVGERTGNRFVYGTSAVEVVREIEQIDIYTALIGRGKGEESGDGFGRKITFEDEEWQVANGDPVDKPLGQKYVEIKEATEKYGIVTKNGLKPRVGMIEFDLDNVADLLSATYDEVVKRARPKVEFRASVVNVGDYNIGDTVTIHRYDLGFHYEVRIFKLIRDRKNNKLTELGIGDKLNVSSVEKQSNITSALKEIVEVQTELSDKINYVAIQPSGNRVTYGNLEPEDKKVGDIWFRDKPSNTVYRQMLVWKGTGWSIEEDGEESADASNLEFGVIDAGGDLNIINLTADSIVGGSLNLARGITIDDGSGVPVLSINSNGEVEMNVSKLVINAKSVEASLLESKNHAEDLVASLEIGGRNLIIRHNELDGTWIATSGEVENASQSTATMATMIPVEPGETYTFSKKDSENSGDGGYWRWKWFDENETFIARKADGQGESSFQWVVPNGAYFIQVSYPTDNAFPKLEKGTKATDWMPAPEDVDEKINIKADQETVDGVVSDLTEVNTSIPTKKEMGIINTALGDYKSAIEIADEELLKAKKEVAELRTATSSVVTNLESLTERWNFLDTYMVAGNDGLLISEDNSNTAIKISTDRIDFLDGAGEPVAFITNQLMQINRGIFVKSATIGEHKQETLIDGHTVTSWVG